MGSKLHNGSDSTKNNDSEADSSSHLDHFFKEIQQVPSLLSNVQKIDRLLLGQIKLYQEEADEALKELKMEKENRLKRFDGWLLPAAKEVLEEFVKDAENLQLDLEEKFKEILKEENQEIDWKLHASKWVQLYSKWNDDKAIEKKVAEVASDHTLQLIDRDIKIINDYHNQSLASLPKEIKSNEEFEENLLQTISNSMQQLIELKQLPTELSTEQTVEWITNLNKHREDYVDDILMKIDGVMRERVPLEETSNPEKQSEIEGELAFIEHEFSHLKARLTPSGVNLEEEITFVKEILQGLKEHLEQYQETPLSAALKERFNKLYSQITTYLNSL